MGILDHGFQSMACANEHCPLHTDHRGGKFKFINGKWYCYDCAGVTGVMMNQGKNLWDFVTTNFNGHPIHVKSRDHLDRLCKQYGVSNHARENYERSW